MKEVHKVAQNNFTSRPTGAHDIQAYLEGINFHLQRLDNVTPWRNLPN